MSFQVTATIPVTEEAEADIINDGWFPNVILAPARDVIRIDGTITTARLRAALVEAITSVNDELDAWKALQVTAGHNNMAAVPAPTVDNISRNIHRYLRAVYCLAKANLTERYRDYDSSNEGNKRADELDPTVGDLRRDHRWAVNDILGIGRSTIELI